MPGSQKFIFLSINCQAINYISSTDPDNNGNLKREGSVEWKRKSCVTAGKTWLIIVSFFLMCQVLPSDFLFLVCARLKERSDRQAHHLDTNRLSGLLSGALPFFSSWQLISFSQRSRAPRRIQL